MSRAGIGPDDGWVRRRLKRERERGRITFRGLAGETRVGSVGPIAGGPTEGGAGWARIFQKLSNAV